MRRIVFAVMILALIGSAGCMKKMKSESKEIKRI